MPRKVKGERRRGDGWMVYVRVRGKLHKKQFPGTSTPHEREGWRQERRRLFGKAGAGTLAADVAAFLAKPQIAAQSYVSQTAYYLACWMEALGRETPRSTITSDDIETVIQRWLCKYAEPTVYHRRSALLSLYTTLDGADAANPVKGTTCPKAWIPKDHSTEFAKLAAIVAAMSDWRYVKPKIKQPAIAKLVAAVVVAVGIRPADLLKVKRSDIDERASAFKWPASTKGKGTSARTVPLTPAGLQALLALAEAGGLGAFNVEAVSHAFKRTARRIDGPDTPIHLYAGRHTLGADIYRETRDLATVGRMLNHTPGSRATAQYAQGANADVDRAAVNALSAARLERPPAKQLPKKFPRQRKHRIVKTLRSGT